MKHGGDLSEAAGRYSGSGPEWLDLSTGINPHPWPVPAALREQGWSRLPSRTDLDGLLAAAREAYSVPDGVAIVAAPGTQALIQWLPRLAPPGPVAVVGPTYAEHAASWHSAGFGVSEIADIHDLPVGVRHVVVVSPNNPDGGLLSCSEFFSLGERCRSNGGWLVVDESFADVVPEASVVGHGAGLPTIVLRSFGKFFGLPGLRLGFAIAPTDIGDLLEEALGPWSVSGPAIAAGTAALADRTWAAGMRTRLADESRQLDRVLVGGGLEILGGTSLYRLARVGGAARLHDRLARDRVWTRRFAWSDDLIRFGLPPGPEDLRRLAASLDEIRREP